MPTSNDTRVRVEGFSKIIASVLPCSGFLDLAPAFSFAFMATLAAKDVAQLLGRNFVEIEKMAQRLAHHPAAFFN